MNVELTVQVIGPDDELEAIGETYAIYRRRLALPFVPQAGLVIALASNLKQDDTRIDEFNRLFQSVAFRPMHLTLKDVTAEVDMSNNVQLRARAADIIEDTILGFKGLEKMLLDFYGFDRII